MKNFIKSYGDVILSTKRFFWFHNFAVVFFICLIFDLIEGFELRKFVLNVVSLLIVSAIIDWTFGGYEGIIKRRAQRKDQ